MPIFVEVTGTNRYLCRFHKSFGEFIDIAPKFVKIDFYLFIYFLIWLVINLTCKLRKAPISLEQLSGSPQSKVVFRNLRVR